MPVLAVSWVLANVMFGNIIWACQLSFRHGVVLAPGTSVHEGGNVVWSGLAMSAGCQSTDLQGNGCLDLFCPRDQLVGHIYVGEMWLGEIWVDVVSEVTFSALWLKLGQAEWRQFYAAQCDDEKPPKDIACDVWGRSFCRQVDCNRHKCSAEYDLSVGLQARSLQCSRCGRWFKSAGDSHWLAFISAVWDRQHRTDSSLSSSELVPVVVPGQSGLSCCSTHCSRCGRCCKSKQGFQLHRCAKAASRPTAGDCSSFQFMCGICCTTFAERAISHVISASVPRHRRRLFIEDTWPNGSVYQDQGPGVCVWVRSCVRACVWLPTANAYVYAWVHVVGKKEKEKKELSLAKNSQVWCETKLLNSGGQFDQTCNLVGGAILAQAYDSV